jgi:hypothetical protein
MNSNLVRFIQILSTIVVVVSIAVVCLIALNTEKILERLADFEVALSEIKSENQMLKSGIEAISQAQAATSTVIRTTTSTLTDTSTIKLSTGPFGLPRNAASVDWSVLNNSPIPQTITVTVFKVLIGQPKSIEPPGAITHTINPWEAFHNANKFDLGPDYEVVVETSSPNVLPSLSIWEDSGNTVIPGASIPSGSWVRLQ